MELFEVIKNRHSYRGPFTDSPVSREDLTRIVQVALAAPSGANGQTTRFVIIDDCEIIDNIRKLHPGSKAMQTAPAFIASIIDKQPEPVYQGMSFQIEDCAAAVENMLLATTALGYATVWIDGWLRRENRAETIGNMINLHPEKIIRILLPIGVPAEKTSGPEKLPFEKRAFYNQYGQ